jgi:hypothetical protein
VNLVEQIGRWMSLRAPQRESLARLHAIAEAVDFKRRRRPASLAVHCVFNQLTKYRAMTGGLVLAVTPYAQRSSFG